MIERYYQQIEGGHWRFAYAMLSDRYRRKITEVQLHDLYAPFHELSVAARQTSNRSISTVLDGHDGSGRRTLPYRENVALTWDGEAWTIDAITRPR